MNLRALAGKLQTALCRKGRIIRINQRQVYIEEAGRMLTKYILIEGNDILLETYRTADVVKFLAGELGDG